MGFGVFGIKRATEKMFQNRDTLMGSFGGFFLHSKKVKGDVISIALREVPAEWSHLR